MIFMICLVSMMSCVLFSSEKDYNSSETLPVSWKRDLKRKKLGHISLSINEAVCCHEKYPVLLGGEPLVLGTRILQLNQDVLGIKDREIFEVLNNYNELCRFVDRTPDNELRKINSWRLYTREIALRWSVSDLQIKMDQLHHPDYPLKDAIMTMIYQQRIAFYEKLKAANLYRQDHINLGACEYRSCFYDDLFSLQRDINAGMQSKDDLNKQLVILDERAYADSFLIDPYAWISMKQKIKSSLSVYGIEKVKKTKAVEKYPEKNPLLFTRYFFSDAEKIAHKILFERLDREAAEQELLKKEQEIHSLQCSPESVKYAEKSLDCIRTLLENEKNL